MAVGDRSTRKNALTPLLSHVLLASSPAIHCLQMAGAIHSAILTNSRGRRIVQRRLHTGRPHLKACGNSKPHGASLSRVTSFVSSDSGTTGLSNNSVPSGAI